MQTLGMKRLPFVRFVMKKLLHTNFFLLLVAGVDPDDAFSVTIAVIDDNQSHRL